MVKYATRRDPGVDVSALVLTGATKIRSEFSGEQQLVVIDGYMAGLRVVFAMGIAAAGVSLLMSLGTRWKKLNVDGMSGVAA
jgi:hypothetical protein